jgi:hypothetical protein
MNAKRDPDRLITAWLDLMPDEAPDRTIAAVHQAVETTPQARRALGLALWRLPRMNRLILAAAVIVAVVGAGMFVLRQSPNVGGPPSPSAGSPTSQPAASPVGAAVPVAVRSTWLAEAAPIAGLGNTEPRLRLTVNQIGSQLSVVVNPATKVATMLTSGASSGAANEFDLVAIGTDSGCTVGDAGRYTTVVSSDGIYLTLTLVSDACAARGATLARTWVRSFDGPSQGGRALVAAFEPTFLVTLPSATYQSDLTPDAATVISTTPDRTLIAVRNPAGFSDPCSSTGGSTIQIAHTIKAFSAYLDTLPGLTVQSASLQIDGHAAAHLVIPTTITADCPTKVNEWTQGDVVTSGGWLIRQGDTDVVYLVEVGSDLYLLQWLGAGVTPTEELSVLSTVHFVNGLPSGS